MKKRNPSEHIKKKNINKFPSKFGLVFIFITILAVDALAGGWA